MAIAILIIPLADTLRIFAVRMLSGKSPFQADRNHIHHQLLDLGLTHREAALTLYLVNIGFILTALALRNISSLSLLYILIGLATVLGAVPFAIRYYVKSKEIGMKVVK
jgi:hypothetical protein